MKKRLQFKKVTLRNLDDDTAGNVAGGGTYKCLGDQTASCMASNCNTCATCLSACGTCGYPCGNGTQPWECPSYFTCWGCDATATCGCQTIPQTCQTCP